MLDILSEMQLYKERNVNEEIQSFAINLPSLVLITSNCITFYS